MFAEVFEISSGFVKRNKYLLRQFYAAGKLFSITFLLYLIFFEEYSFYSQDNTLFNFIAGIIFAAAVSIASIILEFLTLSGSIAAFIIAVPIFGFGGIKWSAPILTFFILSSLLSKHRESRNPGLKDLSVKSDRRDHVQVLANGGTAGVLIIINQIFFQSRPELIYFLFVSSIAAACADTWGTETGTFFKKRTVDILNFKVVAPGSSGGISMPGTLGAAAGALIIALSSLFWIRQNIFNNIFLITAAGFLGSIVDSVLGASVQRKNICTICRKITERAEHCGVAVRNYSGFKWISNDVVNLCCSVSGALFTLLIKLA
ncbi:MAG TPA: DUF92 domain-containing protein [Ignavibacteriaceae bacterium]|nr:DUF92 domain-containing protein [Ignavibacteriaceae bacterium]